MEEKSFTIPIQRVFEKPRAKRAAKAVNLVKRFLGKNFRAQEKQIKLSNKINELLWARGIEKAPRRIEIKAMMQDGIVRAFLKGEKIEKPEKKEEKKQAEAKEERSVEKEKEKEIEEKKKEKKQKERAAEKSAIKRGTG